jgi:integrase/recombinase XerC
MKEFDNYITNLNSLEKSQATIKKYSYDVRLFIELFHVENVEDLYKINGMDWQSFLDSQVTLSANSKNGLIRSISAWVNWMKDFNVIKELNFLNSSRNKFLKVVKKPKTKLTDEDVKNIINAAQNKQDKAMIAILATTGIRRAELCNLKVSDINFSNSKVVIFGKGRKFRTTVIAPFAMDILNDFLSVRNDSHEYLFYGTHGKNVGKMTTTTVYNRVKSACVESGIDPEKFEIVTPHKFRHALITKVAKKSGILAAQVVGGHASSVTTALYIDDNESIVEETLNNLDWSGF